MNDFHDLSLMRCIPGYLYGDKHCDSPQVDFLYQLQTTSPVSIKKLVYE